MDQTTTTTRSPGEGVSAPIRTDVGGRHHRVASSPCEECGCLFDYSLEEPGVIWEAGPDIGDECVNQLCVCHVLPSRGLPAGLHFVARAS
jgi:hypothetical protein